MSSLKEINDKQQRMFKLIDQMTAEEDMTRMLQIVQQLEQEAKELESTALAFQSKMEKQYGKAKRPMFEVVLTPEQRQRILKETGVTMTTVWIEDAGGGLNAAMPTTDPPQIEAEALRQARMIKASEPAKAQARKLVSDSLSEIEAQGPLHADVAATVKNAAWFKDITNFDRKL